MPVNLGEAVAPYAMPPRHVSMSLLRYRILAFRRDIHGSLKGIMTIPHRL